MLIDLNFENCSVVEKEGYCVFYGSGFDENVLCCVYFEDCESCIGLMVNNGVNFVFVCYVYIEVCVLEVWVVL